MRSWRGLQEKRLRGPKELQCIQSEADFWLQGESLCRNRYWSVAVSSRRNFWCGVSEMFTIHVRCAEKVRHLKLANFGYNAMNFMTLHVRQCNDYASTVDDILDLLAFTQCANATNTSLSAA